MASGLDALMAHMARQRIMSPADGIALFASVLGRSEPQLMLTPLDLRVVVKEFGEAMPSIWRAVVRVAQRKGAAAKGAWAHELASLSPAQRFEAVLQTVRAEVARVLSLAGPHDVAADLPLKDLGLDSLMAVQLRNALGKRVDHTLPATLAFDYPTSASIAKYLVERALKVSADSRGDDARHRILAQIVDLDLQLRTLGKTQHIKEVTGKLRALVSKWEPAKAASNGPSRMADGDILAILDHELSLSQDVHAPVLAARPPTLPPAKGH
jgi:acyl carrier protein